MKKKEEDLKNKPGYLYHHCIAEWWPALDANKKILRYKKGALLFKEGDRIQGIHFMIEGVVKVHKHWTDDKELIIRFAKDEDLIGHRGLSRRTDFYPISATALAPVTVCFLELPFFYATLRTNADFMFEMLMFLAGELRLSEQRMRDLAHMPVKNRVAKTLLDLTRTFGLDESRLIRFPVSRQDIAAYTGAAYETVYKLLAEFNATGLIGIEGKNLRIYSEERLESDF